MKANNLSISVPNKGCDRDCPYCISKMTGYSTANEDLLERNLKKVKNMAGKAGVTSVSLTGKGEPVLNTDWVMLFGKVFEDYPIELQTNGLILKEKTYLVNVLYKSNIDIVAISIDNFHDLDSYLDLFTKIKEYGLTIRLTFNLVKEVYSFSVWDILNRCIELGIDQVSFREITSPTYIKNTDLAYKTKKWIEENVDRKKSSDFVAELGAVVDESQFIRNLPYGASLYYYKGVSFTYFNYCIQDSSDGEDIRSLILYEDGHLSTTWYGSDVGRII